MWIGACKAGPPCPARRCVPVRQGADPPFSEKSAQPLPRFRVTTKWVCFVFFYYCATRLVVFLTFRRVGFSPEFHTQGSDDVISTVCVWILSSALVWRSAFLEEPTINGGPPRGEMSGWGKDLSGTFISIFRRMLT